MDEAIDGRERHGLVGEDFAPFAERLVGRYQHGSPLVTHGDQLEQHAGFGLILGDVSEVVENEQIVAVELCNGAFEGQVATRDLELLYEIGRTCEQHAPSVLDQGKPERCREMALAAARRASVMMPGVWVLRCKSSTRFILDTVTLWVFSAASNMVAKSISLSGNRTAH